MKQPTKIIQIVSHTSLLNDGVPEQVLFGLDDQGILWSFNELEGNWDRETAFDQDPIDTGNTAEYSPITVSYPHVGI